MIMNTKYREGRSNHQSYGYQRQRAYPVKTRSGRTTRRTRKYVSERLYENTAFRQSSKDCPIKAMSYEVGPGGTIHKVAKRKKLGQAGIKNYYTKKQYYIAGRRK